jgi:phosphoglycolate phosphatase
MSQGCGRIVLDDSKGEPVDTVLFDMDGTLLDTIDDLHASINYALDRSGLALITRDEARLAAGYGSVVLTEMITKHAFETDSAQFQRVFEDFSNYYSKHCNDNTRPYPGILDLLAVLKKRGIKMAVVSNKVQPETEALRKLWFGEYISLAVGRTDQIPPKPDPTMALSAIEALRTTVEDSLFIGDSQPDVQTGKNTGCVSVGCTWGFRSREVLEAESADYIIDRPLELISILDEIG